MNNFDDVWDSETNEREIQLALHDNLKEKEQNKIDTILYNEGYLNGIEITNEEKYNEGVNKGIEYTKDFGYEIGKIDAYLLLDKFGIKVLSKSTKNKLLKLKVNIEESSYQIDTNLSNKIDKALESDCDCESDNSCKNNCECKK